MKNFIVLLVVLFGSCFANAEKMPITDGIILQSQKPYLRRFIGDYTVRNNSMFSSIVGTIKVRIDRGNRFVIVSNMDITGMNCGSSFGKLKAIEIFPDSGPNAPAEAYFRLNKGRCPGISGNIVSLHYNEALTGADIYLVELLIEAGFSTPRHTDGRKTQTWILEKIPR